MKGPKDVVIQMFGDDGEQHEENIVLGSFKSVRRFTHRAALGYG